jgi:hypothetical protein
MTKVLIAIDDEHLKELIIANGYDEEFIADIEREKADAQKMVEALIKETEQNTAKEIVEYCEKHRTVRKVNGVKYINIEQLGEKYKGVE